MGSTLGFIPQLIELVEVTEKGNAADSSGFGAVPYDFKIGKYEVTVQQYTAFLNAVAATDTYNLYRLNMATDASVAGILRSGNDGSYTYSVIGDGNRPVAWVSRFDAARFCNWLHNDRPVGAQDAGTTEQGAYALNGAISGVSSTRLWGAKFWIPSEDEWYKAAYFDPRTQANGGPNANDNYWNYPTLSELVGGNSVGALPNQGKFFDGSYAVQPGPNRLTPAGAFVNSLSYFGTFDQGGNVWEWNDGIIAVDSRGQRGGSWDNDPTTARSAEQGRNLPELEQNGVGFRIAAQ
jgi:formylglycine-generating enzyme required for sulfatase activity